MNEGGNKSKGSLKVEFTSCPLEYRVIALENQKYFTLESVLLAIGAIENVCVGVHDCAGSDRPRHKPNRKVAQYS